MRIEAVQITKKQYEQYKGGEKIKDITDYFDEIVDSLPQNLREEAIKKGFILEEGNVSMEILTLHVVVPQASNDLKQKIANEFIFCYLD
jgi:hypothetical protein